MAEAVAWTRMTDKVTLCPLALKFQSAAEAYNASERG